MVHLPALFAVYALWGCVLLIEAGPTGVSTVTSDNKAVLVGGAFSLNVAGSSLALEDRIRVVLASTGCSSNSAHTNNAGLTGDLSVQGVAGGTGNSATSLRWTNLLMTVGGSFAVCWCDASVKTCDSATAFGTSAGTFAVETFTLQKGDGGNLAVFAGWDFSLQARSVGDRLGSDERIRVVSTTVTCGSSQAVTNSPYLLGTLKDNSFTAPVKGSTNLLASSAKWNSVRLNLGGDYRVCLCRLGQSCDLGSEFLINVGSFTAGGPQSLQAAQATRKAGEAFDVQVNGVLFSTNDRVRIVDSGVTCGANSGSTSTTLLGGPLATTPTTAGVAGHTGSTATSLKWTSLTLARAGKYTVCFCTSGGGTCNSDSAFGLTVGTAFDVVGPLLENATGGVLHPIAGAPFHLQVKAPSGGLEPLKIAQVRVVEEGTKCRASGAKTNTPSLRGLLADQPITKGAATGNSLRWTNLRLASTGKRRVCLCNGPDAACVTDAAFLVDVGTFDVSGPTGVSCVSSGSGQCLPSISVSLQISGTSLGHTGGRIRIVPASQSCGSAGTATSFWTGPKLRSDRADVNKARMLQAGPKQESSKSTLEVWHGLWAPQPGSYHVCWCYGRGYTCSTDADYGVSAGTFTVHGPSSLMFLQTGSDLWKSTNISAGVQFTLEVKGSGLTSGDRILILEGGTACGSNLTNTAELRGPLANTPQLAGKAEGNARRWLDLRILKSGQYRICYCPESGANGRCQKPVDFDFDIATFDVLGPAADQVFRCDVGWVCNITDVMGTGLSTKDRILVMRQCSSSSSSFLPDPSDDFPVNASNFSGTIITHFEKAVSATAGGITSNGSMLFANFSWNVDIVRGLGRVYELCWCPGDVLKCNKIEEFGGRVGSLTIPGPKKSMDFRCSKGMNCSATLALRNVIGAVDGDRLMLRDSECGSSSNRSIRAERTFLEREFSDAPTDFGQQFAFGSTNSSLGNLGTYRVCWCRPSSLHNCSVPMNFRMDVGEMKLIGASGGQTWFCTRGRNCTFDRIAGFELSRADHYLVLKDCGGNALDGLEKGDYIVGESWVDSYQTFSYQRVVTSGGYYQLCWAPPWISTTPRSCKTLKWNNKHATDLAPAGTAEICASSVQTSASEADKKSGKKTCELQTYDEAVTSCQRYGTRLCWPWEILREEGRGDPCYESHDLLWTASRCSNGDSMIAAGRGHKPVCLSKMQNCDSLSSIKKCVSSGFSEERKLPFLCCANEDTTDRRIDVIHLWKAELFLASAGSVIIRGPEQREFVCTLGRECTMTVTGVGLESKNDWLQALDEDQVCGEASGKIAKNTFVVVRAKALNLTSETNSFEIFRFGMSRVRSILRLCWCSSAGGCREDAEYNVLAGKLTISSSDSEQYVVCDYSRTCKASLTGRNLGLYDRILIVNFLGKASCDSPGQNTTNYTKEISFEQNPAQARNASMGHEIRTFDLGIASMPGTFTICYCITDNPKECEYKGTQDMGSFSQQAGLLEIAGPRLAYSKTSNARAGVPFRIRLEGTGLRLTNRLAVTLGANPEDKLCGRRLKHNGQESLRSVQDARPDTSSSKCWWQNAGCRMAEYDLMVKTAADMHICWCRENCHTDEDYNVYVMTIEVSGVTGVTILPSLVAGTPANIPLDGRSLSSRDRIAFIRREKGKTPICGESPLSNSVEGVGDHGVPVTKDAVLARKLVEGVGQDFRGVRFLRPGFYVGCWCGLPMFGTVLTCKTDEYLVYAVEVNVTGPETGGTELVMEPLAYNLESGIPFTVVLHGTGFTKFDGISVVLDDPDMCGTQVASTPPDGVSRLHNDPNSSLILGPADEVSPIRAVWHNIKVSRKGMYFVCWSGNYSYSMQCLQWGLKIPVGQSEPPCLKSENTHYPVAVGKLDVKYGKLKMIGPTSVTQCDIIDAAGILSREAYQNSRFQAHWTIESSFTDLKYQLGGYVAQAGRNSLTLHIPNAQILDAIQRAKFQGITGSMNMTIMLTIVDGTGVTRQGKTDVTILGDQPIVTVQEGFPSFTMGEDLMVGLSIRLPPKSSCDSDGEVPPLTIRWFLQRSGTELEEELTSRNKATSQLQLKFEEALAPGNYALRAQAEFEGDYAPVSAYFNITVLPPRKPLAALVAPLEVAVGCEFILDASLSSSPDTTNPLNYTWSCARDSSGDGCFDSETWDPGYGSVAIVPAGILNQGLFNFTVTITTHDKRSASSSKKVRLQSGNGDAPIVSMAPVPNRISSNKTFKCHASVPITSGKCGVAEDVEAEWLLLEHSGGPYTTSGSNGKSKWEDHPFSPTVTSAKSAKYENTLQIWGAVPPMVFVPGRVYRCRLALQTNPRNPAFISESPAFLIDFPPVGGSTVVLPTTGEAARTFFVVSSAGWQDDDLPLQSLFLYESPDGKRSVLRGWGANELKTSLGSRVAGFGNIFGRVRDTVGSMSEGSVGVELMTPVWSGTEEIRNRISVVAASPDAQEAISLVSALTSTPGSGAEIQGDLMRLLSDAASGTGSEAEDIEATSQALKGTLALGPPDPGVAADAAMVVAKLARHGTVNEEAASNLLGSVSFISVSVDVANSTTTAKLSESLEEAATALGDALMRSGLEDGEAVPQVVEAGNMSLSISPMPLGDKFQLGFVEFPPFDVPTNSSPRRLDESCGYIVVAQVVQWPPFGLCNVPTSLMESMELIVLDAVHSVRVRQCERDVQLPEDKQLSLSLPISANNKNVFLGEHTERVNIQNESGTFAVARSTNTAWECAVCPSAGSEWTFSAPQGSGQGSSTLLCPGTGEVFALALLRKELVDSVTPAKGVEQAQPESSLEGLLLAALLLAFFFLVASPLPCLFKLDREESSTRQQHLLPANCELEYIAGITIPQIHFFDSFLVLKRYVLINCPPCGGKCGKGCCRRCKRRKGKVSVEAIVPEAKNEVTEVRSIRSIPPAKAALDVSIVTRAGADRRDQELDTMPPLRDPVKEMTSAAFTDLDIAALDADGRAPSFWCCCRKEKKPSCWCCCRKERSEKNAWCFYDLEQARYRLSIGRALAAYRKLIRDKMHIGTIQELLSMHKPRPASPQPTNVDQISSPPVKEKRKCRCCRRKDPAPSKDKPRRVPLMPRALRRYYRLACSGGYPEDLIKEVDEKVLLRSMHHAQSLVQTSDGLAPINEGRKILLAAMNESAKRQEGGPERYARMQFAPPGALQLLLTQVELPAGLECEVEVGQWYIMWVHGGGEILFLQRREALALFEDDSRSSNPLAGYAAGCAVARQVAAQVFDLTQDVENIMVLPEDDEHVVLRLSNGVVFHLHGYSEVRTWIVALAELTSGTSISEQPAAAKKLGDSHVAKPKEGALLDASTPGVKRKSSQKRVSARGSFLKGLAPHPMYAANRQNVITAERSVNEENSLQTTQAPKTGIEFVLLGRTAQLRKDGSDESSWFTYKAATFPHTSIDTYVETPDTNLFEGNANSLPGLAWYSHGGSVLSITVWSWSTEASPFERLKECELEGTIDLSEANLEDETGERSSEQRLSRGASSAGLLLQKKTITSLGGLDLPVLGLYIADIISVYEEPRTDYDIVSNRQSLAVTFESKASLRLFFSTRLERSLVRTSLLRMRSFMTPVKPCTDLVVTDVDYRELNDDGARLGLEAYRSSVADTNTGMHGCLRIKILSAGILWQSAASAQLAEAVVTSKWAKPPTPDKVKQAPKTLIKRNPKAPLDSDTISYGPKDMALVPVKQEPKQNATLENLSIQNRMQECQELADSQPSMFCIVYVPTRPRPERAEIWRSRRAHRTAFPIWNDVRHHEVHFPDESQVPGDVRIEAWDGRGIDSGKPPSYMGEVRMPPPKKAGFYHYHLELQANVDKMQDKSKPCEGYLSVELLWEPTKPSKSSDKSSIEIDATIKALPVMQPPPPARKTKCGTLVLGICKAKGLRRADLLSSDPYCIIRVKTTPTKFQNWKSSVKSSTTNPVWNETREFKVNWPDAECFANDQILIEVWDFDRVSQHDFLGEMAVPFVWHEETETFTVPLQSNRAKSSYDAKGSITISLQYKNEFEVSTDTNLGLEVNPYSVAFGRCFASSVVDDNEVNRTAPYLAYLHFSVWRIFVHCLEVEFRRVSRGLPAVRVPNTTVTRVERYCALVTSVFMAMAAAAYLVPGASCFPRAKIHGPCLPSEFLSPWLAFGAAFIIQVVSCAFILWLFQKTPRATPPANYQKEVNRLWKQTCRAWQFIVCLFTACFIFIVGAIGDEAFTIHWLQAVGCSISARFVAVPLLRAVAQLLVLLISRMSSMFDWLLLLYPSMIPLIRERRANLGATPQLLEVAEA